MFLGFIVRGWVLSAGARGAALRDRHQGGQGAEHLTLPLRPAPSAPRPAPRTPRDTRYRYRLVAYSFHLQQ